MFQKTVWGLLALTLACGPAWGGSEADEKAVRGAILDYVEGVYELEPERIERSVHPELAKRGYYKSDGAWVEIPMTFPQLPLGRPNIQPRGNFGNCHLVVSSQAPLAVQRPNVPVIKETRQWYPGDTNSFNASAFEVTREHNVVGKEQWLERLDQIIDIIVEPFSKDYGSEAELQNVHCKVLRRLGDENQMTPHNWRSMDLRSYSCLHYGPFAR